MGHLESAYYRIRHDVDRLRNLYVEQGSQFDQIGNRCASIQEEHSQQFSAIQDNLAGI